MDADVQFWIQFIAAVALIGAMTSFVIALRRSGGLRRRWFVGAATCSAVVVTVIIAAAAADLVEEFAEFIEEWPFVLAAAIGAASGISLLLWSLFSDRSRGRRRCPKCWYDMSNAPAETKLRCPECGREARRERQLFKTRRRWRWVAASLLIFIAAAYLGIQPKVRQDGWVSVMPTTALILALKLEDNAWAFEALDARARIKYEDLNFVTAMYVPSGSTLYKWQWRLIGDACIRKLQSNPDAASRVLMAGWLNRVCDGLPKNLAEPFYKANLRLLQDEDARVRERAALYCADARWPETSVQSISPLVNDVAPRVRVAAISGFRLLGDHSIAALMPLVSALNHEDAEVRVATAAALGSMADRNTEPDDVFERLVDAHLQDPSERVRAKALSSLTKFKSQRQQARALLQMALTDDSPAIRAEALYAISSTQWLLDDEHLVVNATLDGIIRITFQSHA